MKISDYATGKILEPKIPICNAELEKKQLVRCMRQLKTSSRSLGWRFRKKSNRALKATDFEIIVFSPTSTLKLRLLIDTDYIQIYIEL